MLRVAMVSIKIVLSAFVAAGLGAIDGAEDGMLMEVNGLNVVLVVEGVIESVVGVVVSVVLNFGVAVSITMFVWGRLATVVIVVFDVVLSD